VNFTGHLGWNFAFESVRTFCYRILQFSVDAGQFSFWGSSYLLAEWRVFEGID
jgi:hypothetical protein